MRSIWILCLAILSVSLHAQHDSMLYVPGTVVVQPYFSYASTGSFFSASGVAVSRQHLPSESQGFVTEFNEYRLGVDASYCISNRWMVKASVPLSYSVLQENYSVDGIGITGERSYASLLSPSYYLVGAEYQLSPATTGSAIEMHVRVSPRFHPQTDSGAYYPLMPAGALEWSAGLRSTVQFHTSDILGSFGYRIRTGGLSNELYAHAEYRVYSIDGVMLRFIGDYIGTTGSLRQAQEFNVRAFPQLQSYLALGAGANVRLTNSLLAQAWYSVRITGHHSWALGTFHMGLGFVFP